MPHWFRRRCSATRQAVEQKRAGRPGPEPMWTGFGAEPVLAADEGAALVLRAGTGHRAVTIFTAGFGAGPGASPPLRAHPLPPDRLLPAGPRHARPGPTRSVLLEPSPGGRAPASQLVGPAGGAKRPMIVRTPPGPSPSSARPRGSSRPLGGSASLPFPGCTFRLGRASGWGFILRGKACSFRRSRWSMWAAHGSG